MPGERRRTVLHRLPMIAAGLGFLTIAPAGAEEVTLKAALFVPPSTTYGIPFKRFVEPGFYHRDAHARAAAAVLRAVPDGALVEAVNSVGPRLSGRTRVLLLDDRPRWAPWVVADTDVTTFPFPSVEAQRARVRLLLSEGYSVKRRVGGYVVLNRPGSVPDLDPPSSR